MAIGLRAGCSQVVLALHRTEGGERLMVHVLGRLVIKGGALGGGRMVIVHYSEIAIQ